MGRKPKPETKLIRTSIQLSPTQREAIKVLAEWYKVSESMIIRQAIENFISRELYPKEN